MKAYLCQIDGHSGSWSTGSPVTILLASHDDERLCALNGATWWPAIARLPVLRQDFFDGSFGGDITAPSGEMAVALDALGGLPTLALHDARIRLWVGELGAAWGSFSLLVDGRITDQPSVSGGQASFSFSPDDGWLDKPLLPVYAGTGGLEGGADLAGNVKPLLIGAPRFCESRLIDAVNQVHQLSAGSIAGVDLAFDRLSRYGSSLGNHTTLASLLAASIAPGEWRTCLAQGLVRLGAPADGLLTFHAQGSNGGSRGQVRRAGSIIWRIAELAGATAKVIGSNLDALDAARPWDLSLALTEQTTARQIILDIARSVNATAALDWLGRLWLLPVQIGTAIGTLAADGTSLPPVGDVQQLPVAPPFWRLAQEAKVTQRVHAESEMALVDLASLADLAPLEADIATAQADASDALGKVDIIVSDGWLDRSEKPAVVAQWTAIANEQPVLQARAEAFGITTERATYDSAVSALAVYLTALSPAWNDASQNTAIVRSTFNGKFTDVYYARELLLDRIAAAAAAAGTGNLLIDPLTLAPFSVVSGTVTREDTGAGGPARDRYRLRLDSDGAQCLLQATPIPVRPGETIFVEAAMFTTGAPSGAAGEAGLHWYDAAGAYVGGNAVAVHPGSSVSVWTERGGSIVVPSGAATARPFFQRSGGAGGHFHLSEPYIGRQQAGADVTGSNTAANTAAVGSTPAATVESGANAANAGVNADGTIKDDKVDTPAVITDAIVGPPAGIETSGTFNHTGWSTRGSISYAPYSANSNLLIFIAGVVTIGDASAAGTYAEVRLLKAGLQIFGPVTISRTRGGEQVFSFPVSQSGWSGAETLELQYRASATHGGGDPHLVDSSTIRILEGKNA